ncbi:MAG: LysR family transcriptional regulator [Thalassotalea sp.]|nr:LysR family transcriptional regulator [Thalassotalea sp.]
MVKADDIFLFVEVVDEGSFSKIAEKFELTNSVVSKRISRLEKALNVQLLYRTTRKLTLTDAGSALYGKARIAKQSLQDARDAVTGYGETLKGKIKVTVPAVSADIVLSNAIAEFCQLYPEIEVELFVSNRMVNILDEGFDLAIRTAPLPDSSLVARRLMDSHWVACASPKYVAQNGMPQSPEALIVHQCLVYKYESTGADRWSFERDGKEIIVSVNGRYQANNLDSLRQAAISGLGIAYVPKVLVHEDMLNGKLINVVTPYCAKLMGIYAVYPRSRQPDKKLNLLVEHCREAYIQKQEYFYLTEG